MSVAYPIMKIIKFDEKRTVFDVYQDNLNYYLYFIPLFLYYTYHIMPVYLYYIKHVIYYWIKKQKIIKLLTFFDIYDDLYKCCSNLCFLLLVFGQCAAYPGESVLEVEQCV